MQDKDTTPFEIPIVTEGVITNLKERKPTYDVGFWEYVYALELKPFLRLIERKAAYLIELEAKDPFHLPQKEATHIFRRIKVLSEELNTLYGMKLFMDEMKNCYLDSSEKIYNTYHAKNLALEIENHRLKQFMGIEMNTSQCYLDLAIKLCKQHQPDKNQ
jgi:hypothetical protein